MSGLTFLDSEPQRFPVRIDHYVDIIIRLGGAVQTKGQAA
jgi:hypothetical protein